MGNDDAWKEYDYAFRLEQELTKTRWTVFAALLLVSFVIGGLVLKELASLGPLIGKFGLLFGWLIFMAGFYHYWWFHKKSHQLRDHLCKLEEQLSINVFRIRTVRPQVAGVKIYYHWAIDLMATAYTAMLLLVLFR